MINELKKLIIDRLKVIHNESLVALANHPSIKEKAYGDKIYGAEYKGQKANIVFLIDTNDDFVNAIEELKAEGIIDVKPLDFCPLFWTEIFITCPLQNMSGYTLSHIGCR